MSIMIPPIYLGKPASPWALDDPATIDEFYRQFADPPFSRLLRWLRRRARPAAAPPAETGRSGEKTRSGCGAGALGPTAVPRTS